jgi:RimJ/RimL family protein N-acetyltransferase
MTIPAHTKRLVVREYTLDDLDDVCAVLGDPKVFWWRSEPYERCEVRAWLEEEISLVRAQGIGRYAVQLREISEDEPSRGPVIGGVSLLPRRISNRQEIEIGWHMRSDLWGRGYATEAASALVDEARARGVTHLVAFIVRENHPSARVAAKLGLQIVGGIDWMGSPHDLWAIDLE